MANEIKKTNWVQFCKRFNEANQYRQATVTVRRERENETTLNQNCPFMGMSFTKNGRSIEGVHLYTGRPDPNKLTEPICSLVQPTRILVEKDDDGRDYRLSVESKDGMVANVHLSGEKDPERYRWLVEKVAYSMYERRGYAPGNDIGDWLEAERKIRETENQFV